MDGSPAADRALEWAAAEASRTNAPLHIVTAWLYPMAPGYAVTSTVPAVQHRARAVADAAVARVREAAPSLAVTTDVVEEHPGPALVAAANDAGLLVVGSRGIGGFKELLLGSVSQYCSRHAPCSVVVVR